MTIGTIVTFDPKDITVKDLVLDDLSGYRDMLENDMDATMIDRQATIVMYDIYKDASNFPDPVDMPLDIKRYVAAYTVIRLIPSLRTYVAKYEIRGDTSQEGSVSHYDQLAMLDDLERLMQTRIYELRNTVQVLLATDYSVGPAAYDLPGMGNSSPTVGFATLDPWVVGFELYKNN